MAKKIDDEYSVLEGIGSFEEFCRTAQVYEEPPALPVRDYDVGPPVRSYDVYEEAGIYLSEDPGEDMIEKRTYPNFPRRNLFLETMNRGATARANNETEYNDLPTPTLNAKIVHLAPEKIAQYPENGPKKMPIRQCLLKYAREGEETKTPTGSRRMGVQRRKRWNKDVEKKEGKKKMKSGYDDESPDPDSRSHVKSKTPVLGSDERIVRINGNYGFFSTIIEAYNNHWSIRTCVDDWWYTIIRVIAVAIDDNSKSKEVRKFFVSHEGKKTLSVQVDPSNIYGVDYSWFLDQMTNQIAENIKVPNYVDLLKADFSTSTPTHVIVSEITVMASVQEFFEYAMILGCGIPSLVMEGEEEDWKRMKSKFLQLKDLLKPIHKKIGLDEKWWNGVEGICEHLINTFNGKPDVDWWSNIIIHEKGWPSGPRESYDGWFISDLLRLGKINRLQELDNAVTTVPMTITDPMTGISEESAFAAGIAGFEMFKEKDASWPSVKAVHGWTLMLEPDSVFRADLNKWESQLTKGA